VPEDVALTYFSSIQPVQDGVFAIAGSPTENPAVVRIAGGEVEVRRRSRDATIDPAHLSVPEPIEFPTGGGDLAHAYLYLPVHADYRGLDGERPPVVVIIHGGPTGSASPVLNLSVQYWTTRGFAVADVDYRGSAGYGRQYRRKLERRWGIADVEDCASVVSWLDGQGLVDGGRAVIRGGSAGGFTTLAALAFTERFAAGASHYGVADLELLARDTHKFEARYLDGLIGPWPEDSAVYQERSPIHHVGSITSPLILFQGLEDMVVPADQAQIMFEALRDRGVPVAYLAFAGEQHGFRRAETVVSVMQAELEFYGRVLGFSPSGPEVALPIENEDRLPARA
jgi:dipeptidyl aminopeptidase/acylaminoacyl peptidase